MATSALQNGAAAAAGPTSLPRGGDDAALPTREKVGSGRLLGGGLVFFCALACSGGGLAGLLLLLSPWPCREAGAGTTFAAVIAAGLIMTPRGGVGGGG